MKVVGILYGGKTGEHEVSCRSAASVVANLDRALYEPLLIGIDGEGTWYLQESTALEVASLGLERREERIVSAVPGRGLATPGGALHVDFVFPVLHGTFGEDGTVQGLLEVVELPYAGAGVLGSALGMDKIFAKHLWERAGLPVVPYFEVTRQTLNAGASSVNEISERAGREFGFPVFVKPVCAGSSVGVSKVEGPQELRAALELALHFDTRAMVERSMRGKEVECSVIGNSSPRAFTPGEVDSTHAFYDYEAKYVDPDGAALIVPARLPEEKLTEVRRLAAAAYRACGVTGMARVDFFVDGKSGALYLNEINTIPGFTNISMFSRMCEAEGISYTRLLTMVIELGFEQFQERRSLEYVYRPERSQGAGPRNGLPTSG